ncbi:MAG TPA: type II toxin-antitoxin system VapC family toxin [Candidatus Limnocylindrales bacterium]|nr:type II toxin-antitoxin system VapC family toxin [Candidatus Limnocylindrales bacterium]
MNVYIDSSVVVRILFGEPDPLAIWSHIERAVSSELLGIECLRTLDRVRLRDHLDGRAFGERRRAMLDVIAAIEIVPLEDSILERAGDPFPTSLGTLDAIHLATAIAVRDELPSMVFATHDDELGLAG